MTFGLSSKRSNWCRATIPHMGRRQLPDTREPTINTVVGGAASRSHLLRSGVRDVVPRIHECFPVDGEVPASAQTAVSSEIFNATQEPVVAVETAQDSVETTPKDGESGVRVEDRRSDVRNVWGRVGDVEDHSDVVPILLDSLAEDPLEAPPYTLGDVGRIGVQISLVQTPTSAVLTVPSLVGVRWRTLAMKPLCPIHRPARRMTDTGKEFDLTLPRLDSDEDTFAAVSSDRVGSVDEGSGVPDKPNVHPGDCGWLASNQLMWTVLQGTDSLH